MTGIRGGCGRKSIECTQTRFPEPGNFTLCGVLQLWCLRHCFPRILWPVSLVLFNDSRTRILCTEKQTLKLNHLEQDHGDKKYSPPRWQCRVADKAKCIFPSAIQDTKKVNCSGAVHDTEQDFTIHQPCKILHPFGALGFKGRLPISSPHPWRSPKPKPKPRREQ